MSDPPCPIDTSLFDPVTPPSDDFYRHVNGGWLDANPVPPEYGSWGAFHEVNERNQELLHKLLQEAAAEAEDPGTPAQMAGDYFAAAMDEGAIAAAGVSPLQPYLDRIDAAASVTDVRALVIDLQRIGAGPLHSLGVESDFEDADGYLVYVGQGGLGLPERDYYTRDDERSVDLRKAYVAHIAKQLGNLGASGDAALDAAERILAFETRLAEASYPAEKMRDVQLTMNRHDVAGLDELMPRFGLSSYVVELGVTSPTVNIDNAGFFPSLDAALADTPVETLRDYLRWHLIATYASSLTPAFEDEAFDFYGRTLGGQQKMRPRWKRVLDSATADIGEQVAQLYVDAAFSQEAKAAVRGDGRPPALGDGTGHPRRRVDDRDHEGAGAQEARRLHLQDRLPGQVAGLLGPRHRARTVRREPNAMLRRSSTTGGWAGSASPSTRPNGRCPPTWSTPTTIRC